MPKKYIIYLITVFFLTGCVAMYVPISWEHGDQIHNIIDKDPLLSALYKRYDPDRLTLRGPSGFDELMSPFEVKSHLATYNKTTYAIYINREVNFTDQQLKEIIIHEFCHHIWNIKLDNATKNKWYAYLRQHPSTIQRLVSLYYPLSNQNVENFAFTLQFPQKEDIKELSTLSILNEEEANAVLSQMKDESKYNYWGMGMLDIIKDKQ
jgi:hypothetical protein